jgi:hypothetical protein
LEWNTCLPSGQSFFGLSSSGWRLTRGGIAKAAVPAPGHDVDRRDALLHRTRRVCQFFGAIDVRATNGAV